ncbi:hypothetical protein [Streptomyces spirodelae]|uniref:Uncharacterized protein n=1 Tax=Streptomyces spirodelae TaxID=2812904 RepID=A0ABS3WSN2_9ACTN|nr:hypothetical protein [Streptomyces spirodelae]MBO8186132.1 hypothetical protein [Streptomyces spirodelae]
MTGGDTLTGLLADAVAHSRRHVEHRAVPGRLDPFAIYLRLRGLPSPDPASSALSKDS